MIKINDLKMMNDTKINYYMEYEPQNEKKLLKHRIIKEVLKIDNCFLNMKKEEVIQILKDIGIEENKINLVYSNIFFRG